MLYAFLEHKDRFPMSIPAVTTSGLTISRRIGLVSSSLFLVICSLFNDLSAETADDIALYDAVRSYDASKVVDLLRKGADPNILNERGASLATTLLIPEETSPRLETHWDSSSCFPEDIERIRLEILRDLIKHGLDVNGGSDPALCWAIHYHDYEIVELLVKSGADVNSRDSLGCTPFSMIFSRGVYAEFSSRERLRVAKLLVSHGLKPNMPGAQRRCALSQAIDSGWQNNIELFELLLDAGAAPNSLDRFRKTPLHIAVKKFLSSGSAVIKLDVIELLLKRGADPNIPVYKWRTLRDASGKRTNAREPYEPETLIQRHRYLLTSDWVSSEDREKARSVIALLRKYGGKEELD
jgi:ankyrin repeat protein